MMTPQHPRWDKVHPLRRVRLFRDMLIDEDFRDLVGYLAVDDEYRAISGPKPIGTVFFVHVRDEHAGAVYAVTAQHCLDGNENLYIQARRMERDLRTDVGQWVKHESKDLAVCRVNVPVYRTIKLSGDALPNVPVVAGHDIFTVGLFEKVPGKGMAVEPVVRFGHVALPTAEDVPLRLRPITEPAQTSPATVRLIELHSWGGESGSPVFAYTPHVNVEREPTYGTSLYGPYGAQPNTVWASQSMSRLLGVLHGHFYIDRESAGGSLDVNAGIAVVIRVEDLWEFFMTDERLVEDRKSQGGRPITPPRPDSANQPGS